MALSPLTSPPLSLATVALLLLGASVAATILAHTLRRVRSQDWVVALG